MTDKKYFAQYNWQYIPTLFILFYKYFIAIMVSQIVILYKFSEVCCKLKKNNLHNNDFWL